jgi:hypothetical protein
VGLLSLCSKGEGKDAYKRGDAQLALAFRWAHCANYRGTRIGLVLKEKISRRLQEMEEEA